MSEQITDAEAGAFVREMVALDKGDCEGCRYRRFREGYYVDAWECLLDRDCWAVASAWRAWMEAQR